VINVLFIQKRVLSLVGRY